MNHKQKSHERDVGRAVTEFEAAKDRLLRRDGTRIYGEEEHAERVGKLREDLRERVEAVAAEAQADAEVHEREALALSYSDPSEAVPASERGRLETSRAFVKEDCEDMALPALTERLAAGSDRVAKVLHARYANRRLEALEAESNRQAADGGPLDPVGAARRRELAEARFSFRQRPPRRVEGKPKKELCRHCGCSVCGPPPREVPQ